VQGCVDVNNLLKLTYIIMLYVFQIKPIKNKNQVNLKVVGTIDTEESRFDDEKMNTPLLELMPGVECKFYLCNVLAPYLVSRRKLPVLYLSIINQQKFFMKYLLNITLFFESTTEVKEIKNMRELLHTTLTGKYYIVIDPEGENPEVITLEKYPGLEKIIEQITEIAKSDKVKEIINDKIKKSDEERKERFTNIKQETTIPTVKYSMKDLVQKYKQGIDIEKLIA